MNREIKFKKYNFIVNTLSFMHAIVLHKFCLDCNSAYIIGKMHWWIAEGAMIFTLLAGFLSVACHLVDGKQTTEDVRSTVDKLFAKITSLQVKEDSPFRLPLFWEKKKGMYESDVRFYFHGSEDLFLLREAFRVYDGNMFATAWITSSLLETFRYGNGPKPTDDQITSAILAIREFHDKNVDYANSLMTFWPQKYNETYKAWQSYPINLHHFFDLAATMNATELAKFLDELGLHNLAEIIKEIAHYE